MKSSQKKQKRTRKKKEKMVVGLKSTGQSGAPHRTIWCAPDSLVNSPANCMLSWILACVDYNSPDRPCGAPDTLVCQPPTASCHVGRGPTVKWSTGQSGAPLLDGPVPPKIGNQPITRFCARALFTVRCAPDSLVHPRTEGNQSLSNGVPMASRSLGAIKVTTWRMKLHTKHPLNILQHQDAAITPLLR